MSSESNQVSNCESRDPLSHHEIGKLNGQPRLVVLKKVYLSRGTYLLSPVDKKVPPGATFSA